jgi:heterodisulfide reductase subunit A-like polyferredoxin
VNIKVILCNCDGLKFMPESLDMNTLPHELENDSDVTYALMHPQLCGSGGVSMLRDLLKSAGPDDYFVVAGCGPDNQPHFLGHVLDEIGFPEERFVGVNIRCSDNSNARDSVLRAVGELITIKNANAVDAFGG